MFLDRNCQIFENGEVFEMFGNVVRFSKIFEKMLEILWISSEM